MGAAGWGTRGLQAAGFVQQQQCPGSGTKPGPAFPWQCLVCFMLSDCGDGVVRRGRGQLAES